MNTDRLAQIERTLLAAPLLDPDLWPVVSQTSPDDWLLDSHVRIQRAESAVIDSGVALDCITLMGELDRRGELAGVGGLAYLTDLTKDLTAGLARSINLAEYVRMMREAAGKRFAAGQFDAAGKTALDEAVTVSELAAKCERIRDALAGYSRAGCVDLATFPDPLELPCEPDLWLVPGIVLRNGITQMAGAPGEGKTWQALAIARAVAFGGEYVGRKCERAEVLILDYENPKSIMQARWQTVFKGPVGGGVALWAPWSGRGEVPRVGSPLLADLARPGRLLIFDTLSGAHGAKDENSAADMGPILGQFRELVNRGASVLLLHHRGKNELSRYRGSSAISAGVDVGCALIKGDDGLLTLDVYKTRATSEFKLTIQPNYERGQFELVDSPARVEHRDDAAAILKVICEKPGLAQNQLLKLLPMRREQAIDLLRSQTGQLWRTGSGPRGAKIYFAITTGSHAGTSSEDREPEPVPVPPSMEGNREPVVLSAGGGR